MSGRSSKPPAIGERLLTLKEAAEVLHLSPRTVREYVHRGEIEARVIGGRYGFRRVDLDAFFANAPQTWDFSRNANHEEEMVNRCQNGRFWGYRKDCENVPCLPAHEGARMSIMARSQRLKAALAQTTLASIVFRLQLCGGPHIPMRPVGHDDEQRATSRVAVS